MIETEKTSKFSQKIPKKPLKFAAEPRFAADGGGLPIFSMTGGFLSDPPWPRLITFL